MPSSPLVGFAGDPGPTWGQVSPEEGWAGGPPQAVRAPPATRNPRVGPEALTNRAKISGFAPA